MNTNDGTQNPPRLRLDLNLGTVQTLPEFSTAPRGEWDVRYATYKAAGFQGIQGGEAARARQFGLGWTTGGRVNAVGEADAIASKAKDDGADCVTLHVGWGIEDDAAVDALVADILNAQTKHGVPMYIETHRATITQDIWRTVQIVKRHPDVRINGDFSHWYTGLEMPYGTIERKLDFAQPVLERVRFIHGRIGNPGSMQVDIGDGTGRPYVDHFRLMWTRAFTGFLKTARPGDYICFTPELLHSLNYYARVFPNAAGELVEEGDRWQQALLYCQIARECFANAMQGLNTKD
jgi:hypothetical protein